MMQQLVHPVTDRLLPTHTQCSALGSSYDQKFHSRLHEVKDEVETTGFFELSYEELTFGARTAWRNAPRCVNRIVWRQLEVSIWYNSCVECVGLCEKEITPLHKINVVLWWWIVITTSTCYQISQWQGKTCLEATCIAQLLTLPQLHCAPRRVAG